MDYLKKRTLMIIIAAVLFGSTIYGLHVMDMDSMADSIERDIDNIEKNSFEEEQAANDSTEAMTDESEDMKESGNSIIFVDIDGAVNKPGTFQLPYGTRLCTLIEIAGGLLENADTRHINRAERLQDEQKVYIPEKGEGIDSTATDLNEGNDTSGEIDDGMININTAGMSSLESLPGIGDVLAARIIEYRENNKCFTRIEDVKKVSGIADGKFEQIKGLIKVK